MFWFWVVVVLGACWVRWWLRKPAPGLVRFTKSPGGYFWNVTVDGCEGSVAVMTGVFLATRIRFAAWQVRRQDKAEKRLRNG